MKNLQNSPEGLWREVEKMKEVKEIWVVTDKIYREKYIWETQLFPKSCLQFRLIIIEIITKLSAGSWMLSRRWIKLKSNPTVTKFR